MMLTRSFLAIASWCCLLVVAQHPATVSAFTTTTTSSHHGRTAWATDQQQQQPGLHMATWSDSKAVMDYQAFLSSGKQELELAKDMPSVIIQPQDTPSLWAQCLQEMGQGQDLVLHPGMDLPETVQGATEYPIYIALPPTQLNDFLQNLRPSYKEGGHQDDFVFLSGGYEHGNIEHVLQARGYCRDQMTQVVVSGLHVAPNGRPQDLSVNLGLDSQGEAKVCAVQDC
uniref:Subtilisin n=1 Tax=Entomoneis paludosa TaxID=265537 RepID=A0A7S2YIE7_9STRA|mmetsp:Transcript_34399/g.71624  ORF Transcript_34399/g.71624 Transcript_34399/m.71624 type:complete len:227 (+) Transcript_34399:42-722(+)